MGKRKIARKPRGKGVSREDKRGIATKIGLKLKEKKKSISRDREWHLGFEEIDRTSRHNYWIPRNKTMLAVSPPIEKRKEKEWGGCEPAARRGREQKF